MLVHYGSMYMYMLLVHAPIDNSEDLKLFSSPHIAADDEQNLSQSFSFAMSVYVSDPTNSELESWIKWISVLW